MISLGQKSTDDRGRYRLGNLAPGSYIVCTGGGQNAQAPLTGPVDYSTRVDNRYYVRTCSRTFQLSPGQRAQIDLTPAAGRMTVSKGVAAPRLWTQLKARSRPAAFSRDITSCGCSVTGIRQYRRQRTSRWTWEAPISMVSRWNWARKRQWGSCSMDCLRISSRM